VKTWPVVALVAGGIAAGAAFQLARKPASAPPAPPAPAPELVSSLPVFQLADRYGQSRSLQDWPGQPLIVNFWATWCAPCRREIPLLQQIQREHGGEGFQVVGIAVDFRDKVLAYAEEMRIEYPLLIGEQEALDAAAAFGVGVVGFPFTIFSDRQGRVVTAHIGELTAAQAGLILDAVRQVDAGRLSIAAARESLEAALAALPAVDD
jgi:thiol-disulfide isomerase/thioredoxin